MKAAVFLDMDGTLLRGESQFSFLVWCWRRHVLPPARSLLILAEYAGYLLGVTSDARRLRASGFALLRGIPVERIENAGRQFFAENLARQFRVQCRPLIEAHRQRGHVIVLITSASEPVASPIATALAVDAMIATRLVAHNATYTGERQMPEPYHDGKRLLVERFCAERGIDVRQSFAYTDHHSDLPLLEAVGRPVAANPTKKLRRIADARGWKTMDLDSPELVIG